MIGIGVGIPHQKGIKRLKFLLDEEFAQGATAAYSLRLLREKHSGGIIRCRADDNGTSKGEADVLPILQPDGSKIITLNSPIENFSGTPFSGDGYVLADLVDAGNGNYDGLTSSWYDQSGNANDASNSTASEQPQIVSGGSVIQENGQPAIQFDGSDDYLINNFNPITITEQSTFSVQKIEKNSDYIRVWTQTSGSTADYKLNNPFFPTRNDAASEWAIQATGQIAIVPVTFPVDTIMTLVTDSSKGSLIDLKNYGKNTDPYTINQDFDKFFLACLPNQKPAKMKMNCLINYYNKSYYSNYDKIVNSLNDIYNVF